MNHGKKKYKFLSTIGLLFTLSTVSYAYGAVQQADSIAAESAVVTDTDSVYTQPQKWPVFPGGELEQMNYIKKKLIFPHATWVEGSRVVASFIVEKDGTITNVEVEKVPIFDIENSEKVVKNMVEKVFYNMPKWEPGQQDGKTVRTLYHFYMSIHFQY